MDIKELVEKAVESITKDKAVMEKFKKDPANTLKEIFGDKIPDGALDKVIAAVKAKISGDKISNVVDGIGKIFQK